MDHELQYDPVCCRSRWLAYFDLLGTRELLRSCDYFRVFSVYEKATREVTSWNSRLPRLRHAWFSDSFLIYSESDTDSDFAEMDMISRWFMHFLILAEIPLRGALACGGFYADLNQHVYLGEALVEAYECGEAQDWIGFVLCPSAIVKLDEVRLPAAKLLNYAYFDIPRNDGCSPRRLPACILGSWSTSLNGDNELLSVLRQMRARQLEDSIIRKYENAISFIEGNQRSVSGNGQPCTAPNDGPAAPVDSSSITEGSPSVS